MSTISCVWHDQVGWWVGLAEGGNDPYGRIINIYAAHGRLVAKGYTARFAQFPSSLFLNFSGVLVSLRRRYMMEYSAKRSFTPYLISDVVVTLLPGNWLPLLLACLYLKFLLRRKEKDTMGNR